MEWILWSPSTQTALIIIPEEAELLIPKLIRVKEPKVHLIAYAAPITRAMIPFNQLRYYSLPPIPADAKFPAWLRVELGIVAGQLYVDFEEWKLVSDYLRASHSSISITPAFLLEWLGNRCRAQDILHTPMGYICLGRTLSEDHAFFVRSTPVVTPMLTAVRVGDNVEEIEDEGWEEEEDVSEEDESEEDASDEE